MDAAGELDLFAADADIEKQLQRLQELGRPLEDQPGDAVATLEPLARRFQRWSATLLHCSILHADLRDRLLCLSRCRRLAAVHGCLSPCLCGHAGRRGAGARDPPPPRWPGAAGRRDEYRHVLAEQRERMPLHDRHFDKLNAFGRHVRAALAWVFVSGRDTGSGFLAAPDLVVTNRHVVVEGDGPAAPGGIVAHVAGAARPVARVQFPPNPELDLALLELA